jgi:xanthine/uracil permease
LQTCGASCGARSRCSPSLGFAETLSLPIWAGICVAVGVGLMILGSNIPIFSAIPATVYGYAATVAFALLTADGVNHLTQPDVHNTAAVIALSMIGGAIFGLISEALAGVLAKS